MFFSAGFPALREAMIENEKVFPRKRFEILAAIAEGGRVAVHSRLNMGVGGPDMAVVHLFRFRRGKIAELWDLGQAVPADSPNEDGAF